LRVAAISASIIAVISVIIAVRCTGQKEVSFNQEWVSFNSQEILYAINILKELGFPVKSADEISMKDMLKALCKLNIRENRYEDIANSIENLSDKNTYQKQFPLIFSEKTANIELPEIRNYQYEIVNKGEETIIGPILYQKYLWDTVQNLIASAGYNSIADETERAKAIWRFMVTNRYHFAPVTEGEEEHDIIKYICIYGYGLCDDTAGNLSKLAEMTGFKARTWVIGEGRHLVSEIYANGKWRMFDADRDIYFYDRMSGELYGVEEISQAGNLSRVGFYTNRRKDILKTEEISFYTSGRKKILKSARADHKIRYCLRPREKIVFMNRNIGKYFLGKYPQNIPEYYNGFFDYHLNAADLNPVSGKVSIKETGDGIVIANDFYKEGSAEVNFKSSFPFVGGSISGSVRSEGDTELLLTDQANNITHHYKLTSDFNLTTDAFFAVLTPSPTYTYSVIFRLKADSSVHLSSFRVKTYFQFAKTVLLNLHKGQNSINIHFPDKKKGEIEASVRTD